MRPTVEQARQWAGGVAVAVAVVVLLGWATGVDELRAFRAGYSPMVPWAAVGFALVGVAVARRGAGRSWILAVVAACIGVVHLAAVVLDVRLWPVGALFRAAVEEAGPGRPGEMSPLAAALFVSAASGVVALRFGYRRTWLAASGATLAGAVLATTGYLYGVSTLYTVGEYTAMALPTAVAFVFVGLGVGSDRENPLVGLWADAGSAGWLIRHAVPLALVVPPALGGLQLALTRRDTYDVELGLAAIAVSWMVLDVVALVWAAGQLRRLESDRDSAWREVDAGRRRLVSASEAGFRRVSTSTRSTPVAVLRVDPVTGAMEADAELAHLAGTSSDPERWTARIHPEDRSDALERLDRAAAARESLEVAFRFLRDDGTVVHVVGACGPDARCWSCAFADVTTEVEGRQAAALVQASFRSSPIGTAIVDVDGRVVECNDALAQLVRAPSGELEGRPLVDCFDRRERLELARMLDARSARADLRLVAFDGTRVWADVNVSPIPDVARSLVSFIDVTDRHDAEERLTEQALRDPLTGLPNRVSVHERLAEALARSDRSRQPVAVLFCDLDAFKVVNDSLGHDVGDRVLAEAAARVRHAVRPFDLVGRMGGDEFVIVCEDADEELATALAVRIKQRLAEPLVVGDHELAVGASIGIAISGPGATGPDMVRDADTAMYRAKGRGRNRYEVFDGGLRRGAVRRFAVEQALRQGLDGPAFGVGYEAVLDVATGAVVGAEALLRWHEPGRDPVPPLELLPIAEESGLIRPLGERVLLDALRSAAEWRASGLGLWVAVNVSAKQLGGHGFVDAVERALAATNVEPRSLVLELTESALSDIPDSAARDLQHLREIGVRLAMDDFGTGWSSLERLHTMAVDILKIDQLFVAGIGSDRVDQSIVRGLIELGQRTALITVAEGVETEAQAEALASYGCDLAQGYLLHRTASASSVASLAVARRPSLPEA